VLAALTMLAEESLSTNQQIALSLVCAAFVSFALVSSFALPAKYPDFPGSKRGVVIFSCVSFAFFAAMMLAVIYV
jgi:hypothetical protein